MHTSTNPTAFTGTEPLDVRVCGPDCETLTPADLRRLFPGSALTEARLDRLQTWSRIAVTCKGFVIAVATCQKTETELRVPEIGIDLSAGCDQEAVMSVLLDALELAGLAGGCRRLVVMPPKVPAAFLRRRGYSAISERCAGAWLEKTLV